MYIQFIGSNLVRLARAALFALLIAAAAVTASPAAAAVPGLDRTEDMSSLDSHNFKGANAKCPPGKKVIGGGAMLSGGGAKIGLVSLGPNADNTIYGVAAQEISGGTTESWRVTAYALCANASAVPGLEKVEGPPSAHNSLEFKQAFADCPTGKKLVGLGASVLPVNNGAVALFQMVPRTSSLKGVTVGAAEIDGGTTQNWSVRAVALCVNQNSAIDVELVSMTDSSGTGVGIVRTLNCPAGKKVISGGLSVLDAPFSRLTGIRIEPREDKDLRSITLIARESALGTTAKWKMTSYALCATP
jgi:hypothetical protein